MANRTNKTSTPNKVGLLAEIVRNVQLVWRLLLDPRVSLLTKLVIPGLAVAYFLWPADLMPDVFLGLGQLDDLMLLALATKLFIDLCPTEIVRQYRNAAAGVTSPPKAGRRQNKSDTVVDAEYRIVE